MPGFQRSLHQQTCLCQTYPTCLDNPHTLGQLPRQWHKFRLTARERDGMHTHRCLEHKTAQHSTAQHSTAQHSNQYGIDNTLRFSTSASSSLICFLSFLRLLSLTGPGCLLRRSSRAAITSACSLITLLFLFTKSSFCAYLQTDVP